VANKLRASRQAQPSTAYRNCLFWISPIILSNFVFCSSRRILRIRLCRGAHVVHLGLKALVVHHELVEH
jgi:hypothetical protein